MCFRSDDLLVDKSGPRWEIQWEVKEEWIKELDSGSEDLAMVKQHEPVIVLAIWKFVSLNTEGENESLLSRG